MLDYIMTNGCQTNKNMLLKILIEGRVLLDDYMH